MATHSGNVYPNAWLPHSVYTKLCVWLPPYRTYTDLKEKLHKLLWPDGNQDEWLYHVIKTTLSSAIPRTHVLLTLNSYAYSTKMIKANSAKRKSTGTRGNLQLSWLRGCAQFKLCHTGTAIEWNFYWGSSLETQGFLGTLTYILNSRPPEGQQVFGINHTSTQKAWAHGATHLWEEWEILQNLRSQTTAGVNLLAQENNSLGPDLLCLHSNLNGTKMPINKFRLL